ncbi:MAG: histidine kinase [Peptococcaceae bacterium BICA1-8]|nr:MAG: histidine kinase [Peptococcaceae bacterium BICA1-8]
MFIKKSERVPLLRYWTTRYVLTLCIGLIVIGIISSFWLRYNTTQKGLNSIKSFSEEIAASSIDQEGNLSVGPYLSRMIDIRQRFLHLDRNLTLFITDREGRLIYSKPSVLPLEILKEITIPMDDKQGVQELTIRSDIKIFVVKQPIQSNGQVMGNVFIVHPVRELVRSTEEFQLLAIMLIGLGILGWLIIYLLTRKLAKPIKDVAEAANQILKGDYDIKLDKDIRELEIYELTNSFKEMTERLRQLEAMRTELLAGVTHELKTPVASISGLIQAVKDEVVTGEEAKEFLGICESETARLQKMVEDLLDFNSFITGDIKVNNESHDINLLVQEIAYQWLIGQDARSVILNTYLPDKAINIETDAMRLQQVLYNLFNNAKQAAVNGSQIDVHVSEENGQIRIDVKDNGAGIPEEERQLIFERFFRGKAKKDRVRGLGLGLSFSKMIANALGGDLFLNSSSSEGTVFTLTLKIN